LAADQVAGAEVIDVGADLDDLADELVADDHGHGDGPAGPVVPLVDVDVGAADAGALDADQDVVDADSRPRHVLPPQRRLRLALTARFRRHTLACSTGSPPPHFSPPPAGPQGWADAGRPETTFLPMWYHVRAARGPRPGRPSPSFTTRFNLGRQRR